MIDLPPVNNIFSLLTRGAASDEALSLKPGVILSAEVMDITEEGNGLLRLTLPGGAKDMLVEAVLKLGEEIPFVKGQGIVLKVIGGKGGINVQIMDAPDMPPSAAQDLQQDNYTRTRDVPDRQAGAGLLNTGYKISLNTGSAPVAQTGGKAAASDVMLLAGASGRQVLFRAGDIIKAEVTGFNKEGNALLRVLMPAGRGIGDDIMAAGKQAAELILIRTEMERPLLKGQNIFLRILGGRKNIRAEMITGYRTEPGSGKDEVPEKALDRLAASSAAKLSSQEIKQFADLVRTFPASVHASAPEFKMLEKLLDGPGRMSGDALRNFIQNSGVALETKLKAALPDHPGKPAVFNPGGDLKELLLRIRSLLSDRAVVGELADKGIKAAEVSMLVDRFINNVEFSQVTSKINDMLFTFLPIFWNGFRETECMFKKGGKGKNVSYSCDLNLDLERLGRMSVSVTVLSRAFHVNFYAEKEETRALINAHMHKLGKKFLSRGLVLRTVNVHQKKDIVFGRPRHEGVSFRV